MKPDIHPEYFTDAKTVCACGTTHTIGSTEKEVSVELCSACHPFYTGTQKLVDSAQRVDRFKKLVAKQKEAAEKRGSKKERRAKRAEKSTEETKDTEKTEE